MKTKKSLYFKHFSVFRERISFQLRIYSIGAHKDDLYFTASVSFLGKQEESELVYEA